MPVHYLKNLIHNTASFHLFLTNGQTGLNNNCIGRRSARYKVHIDAKLWIQVIHPRMTTPPIAGWHPELGLKQMKQNTPYMLKNDVLQHPWSYSKTKICEMRRIYWICHTERHHPRSKVWNLNNCHELNWWIKLKLRWKSYNSRVSIKVKLDSAALRHLNNSI